MKVTTLLVQIPFIHLFLVGYIYDNSFGQILWYILLCVACIVTKIVKVVMRVSFFIKYISNHFGLK